jgi:hypothetical protein
MSTNATIAFWGSMVCATVWLAAPNKIMNRVMAVIWFCLAFGFLVSG